jgi:hypothetical protein
MFVVTPDVLVAVNAGASREAIDAVWRCVADGAPPIESVVGAIPFGSDDSIHSFAVARFDEGAGEERRLTALVRGSAAMDIFSVGGGRRFQAAGVQPWLLADFLSVVAVSITSDDRPAGSAASIESPAWPIAKGVVSGARLLWSAAPLTEPAVQPGSPIGDVEDTVLTPRPPRVAVPQTELDDETIIVPRRASAPVAGLRAVQRPESEEDPDLDETIIKRPRPTQETADEDTVLTGGHGTRAHPAMPSAPPPPRVATFRIRIGDEDPRLLTGPTIVGRNPSAPRIIAGRPPELIAVDSPDQAVSSSHVRLTPEGGCVVVTDLRSTNGTMIALAGTDRRRMRPGESVVVPERAVVEIGDGNIIDIMPIDSVPHATGDETGHGRGFR